MADDVLLNFDLDGDDFRQQIEKAILEPLSQISPAAKAAAEGVTKAFDQQASNLSKAFTLDQARKQLNALPDDVKKAMSKAGLEFEKMSDTAVQSLASSFKDVIPQIDQSLSETVKLVNGLTLEIKNLDDELTDTAGKTAVNEAERQKALQASAAAAIVHNKEALALLGSTKQQTKNTTAAGQALEKQAEQSQKLTTKLKALKDEISKLEQAGKSGTKQFRELLIEAAQLEDQIGDTSARIKILASDTFAFDALVDGAQKATAVFGLLQGTTALFGEESEDLQRVLIKLNAVQAIANGLQQVSALIKEEGAAKTFILTAAEKANTIATAGAAGVYSLLGLNVNTAATSFKVLRGAMLAVPIVAVVALVATLITSFNSASESADEFGKTAREAMDESAKATQSAFEKLLQAQLNYLAISKQITETERDRRQIINERDKAIQESYELESELINKIREEGAKRQDETEKWWKSDKAERREKIKIQEDVEKEVTRIVADGNLRRGAIEAASQKELDSLVIKSRTERNERLIDLEKLRINAEIAAQRARLQLITDLTKEGSELNKKAIEDQVAFELTATLRLLEIEKKERLKALKESGVATKADYDALNKEIEARAALSKEQTNTKLLQLDREYREKYLQEERDFQERAKQIAIDARVATYNAVIAAQNAINELENNTALRRSVQGTKARLDAENAIIREGAKQRLQESQVEFDTLSRQQQILSESGQQLAEKDAARLAELAAQRVEIEKDADQQILENTESFYNQRAQLILDTANQAIAGLLQIEQNFLQTKLQDLETEKEAALSNANLTAEQKKRIEERYLAESKKIKRQQAINDKAAALFAATINVAKAITENISNPVLAGITAALGAIQIAAIASQPIPKFKEGGKVKGKLHEHGGTIIEAERGEFIIRRQQALKHPQEVEALNHSTRKFNELMERKYRRPALLADRMASARDQRRVEYQRPNFTTKKVERGLKALQKQGKRDTDRLIGVIQRNKEQIRNNW